MKDKILDDKKVLPVLVLLSLIAGAMIGFYYPREEKPTITNFQSFTNPNPNPTISVTTISEKSDMFNIDAQYPQFTAIAPNFNAKIVNLINERINNFKKNSTENWQARKDTATPEDKIGEKPETPFYFKVDWAPAQVNKKYISIVLNLYSFSGGAHGDSEVYTFNYDLASKKEISFNDIIGNSQDNLKTISKLAVEDVVNQRGNFGETDLNALKKELEEGGAGPNLDNFNNFTFDNNLVTIYYQKYQVGPGALGIIKSLFQKSYLVDQNIKSEYLK